MSDAELPCKHAMRDDEAVTVANSPLTASLASLSRWMVRCNTGETAFHNVNLELLKLFVPLLTFILNITLRLERTAKYKEKKNAD